MMPWTSGPGWIGPKMPYLPRSENFCWNWSEFYFIYWNWSDRKNAPLLELVRPPKKDIGIGSTTKNGIGIGSTTLYFIGIGPTSMIYLFYSPHNSGNPWLCCCFPLGGGISSISGFEFFDTNFLTSIRVVSRDDVDLHWSLTDSSTSWRHLMISGRSVKLLIRRIQD